MNATDAHVSTRRGLCIGRPPFSRERRKSAAIRQFFIEDDKNVAALDFMETHGTEARPYGCTMVRTRCRGEGRRLRGVLGRPYRDNVNGNRLTAPTRTIPQSACPLAPCYNKSE